MTDRSPAPPRLQALLFALSAAWGVYFFHALADLSWAKAVTLSTLASAGYLVEPTTPRGTAVLGTLVGAFLGLGAWWTVDLGPLSLLVGLAGGGPPVGLRSDHRGAAIAAPPIGGSGLPDRGRNEPCQALRMQAVINLDDAAAVLERHAEGWRSRGMSVGQLTWADGQTFGNPVTTERSEVRGDYSVGIAVRAGTQEGELILYSGGWCDLRYWSGIGDIVIDEAPGWDDWLSLPAFEVVVERFGRLFT